MHQIIAELEKILNALSRPDKLEGDELSRLNIKWVRAITRLKEVVAKKLETPREDAPMLRQRLEKVLARMPEIQTLLANHKSEVADQLFLETRRVQAVRQGAYSASKKRTQILHHRA
ncbi:MAG: hypothetical protein HQL70_03820 [Magnetococcales bacterium]|nr:hypothetical protein [Magnetococcales bacterium]